MWLHELPILQETGTSYGKSEVHPPPIQPLTPCPHPTPCPLPPHPIPCHLPTPWPFIWCRLYTSSTHHINGSCMIFARVWWHKALTSVSIIETNWNSERNTIILHQIKQGMIQLWQWIVKVVLQWIAVKSLTSWVLCANQEKVAWRMKRHWSYYLCLLQKQKRHNQLQWNLDLMNHHITKVEVRWSRG